MRARRPGLVAGDKKALSFAFVALRRAPDALTPRSAVASLSFLFSLTRAYPTTVSVASAGAARIASRNGAAPEISPEVPTSTRARHPGWPSARATEARTSSTDARGGTRRDAVRPATEGRERSVGGGGECQRCRAAVETRRRDDAFAEIRARAMPSSLPTRTREVLRANAKGLARGVVRHAGLSSSDFRRAKPSRRGASGRPRARRAVFRDTTRARSSFGR